MKKIVLCEDEMPTSWYNYLAGNLHDYAYPKEQIVAALAKLPKVD